MAFYRRWRWALLGLLLLGGLAAVTLFDWRHAQTARPALWRISQGDRHAWLFGTIHAVPPGARWLSPAIEQAARESDVLMLEASGLEAERAEHATFERLGRSPGLPPVAARLGPADRARLAALQKASPETLRGLDGYESWAAALLIGAAADQGVSQEEAGEATFEEIFRRKGGQVLGLETIEAQLGAFDSLPEADQRAMLAQAVSDSAEARKQFDQLYARWAAGDIKALEAQFLPPLRASPRLRVALLDQRNANWARQIDTLLKKKNKVAFIAVGAGHLLGPDSVGTLLAARGWHVQRVQ